MHLMKSFTNYTNIAILLLMIFSSLSCEKQPTVDLKLIDEDMDKATKLADQYLESINARRKDEKAVTVLRMDGDVLYYATNTDNIRGYQPVTAETITANVAPGAHVFWFAGTGIKSLDGIEFDNSSQAQLQEYPSPYIEYRLWKVTMPEVEASSDEEVSLKYDILYTKMNGEFIRLDPKLRIINQ